MKPIFKAVTLAAIMACAPLASAAQKTAVIFPSKIMKESPQRERITKKLESEFKDRIAELKDLEEEVNKLQVSLQRDGELMDEYKVTSLQRKIEIKAFEYKLKREGLTKDNRRRQGELQQQSWADIQDVINSVAKDAGYDLVLNGEQILYADPKLDISNLVIEEFSKK